MHDWTDLPEEEIPELQQIATGGLNPEAARQMVENLQACKGRGKTRVEHNLSPPSIVSLYPVQPSNVSGYSVAKKEPHVGHF